MPKIPSRPTNTTLVLPGTGSTTAHTGRAGAKFYTLDPLTARNEVLSAQADPLARAQALTTETLAPAGSAPAMAPRRALRKLLHGAARGMGFARGEPVEIEVYEGAYHGFDSTSPVRVRNDVIRRGQPVHVGGHPPARERAYARIREFLGKHLPPQ